MDLGSRAAMATVREGAILEAYRKRGHDVQVIEDISKVELCDIDKVKPNLALAYTATATVEGAAAGFMISGGEIVAAGGGIAGAGAGAAPGIGTIVGVMAADAAAVLVAANRAVRPAPFTARLREETAPPRWQRRACSAPCRPRSTPSWSPTGRSKQLDALAVKATRSHARRAAREALARERQTVPRCDGAREAVRLLLTTRDGRSGPHCGDRPTQGRHHGCPADLRERLRHLTGSRLVESCLRLRTDRGADTETRVRATTLEATVPGSTPAPESCPVAPWTSPPPAASVSPRRSLPSSGCRPTSVASAYTRT
jgi:hypothetical protein